MAMPKPDARTRDRESTERAILGAARQLLTEEGFTAFGVNAVARQAGCDKQLIYRYFGGLDGLADAIGAGLADDLSLELKPLAGLPVPATYGALMERLLIGLFDLLRANRLLQQVAAWEIAAASPLAARMIAARSQRMGRWMHETRGALTPPAGVDAAAVNAILVASIQQLVISGAASGAFSDLALDSENDWRRVRHALTAMIRAIYGP